MTTLKKELDMSVINTEIKPFKAQAFKNGEFIEVSDADVKGNWAVFFFYPADFTMKWDGSWCGRYATYSLPERPGCLVDADSEHADRDLCGWRQNQRGRDRTTWRWPLSFEATTGSRPI